MMKKLKCLLLAAVCFFAGSFTAYRLTLSRDVVRIHVVANSDSEADQRLKLRVRDAVLAELRDVPREKLEAALPGLRETAQAVLEENGDDSAVVVSLGRERFGETTSIDGVSLPAGSYETLRLTIGDGAGHNWWGVLFPRLGYGTQSCLETDARPHPRSFFLEKLAAARQWVQKRLPLGEAVSAECRD